MISRIKNKLERIQHKRSLESAYRKIKASSTMVQEHEILNNDSPVVLCLLRNGEYFIDDFMAHYLALGFTNFVFIDNKSDDQTVSKLKEYKVNILSCDLPYKNFKYFYKQYLVKKFAENRWSLYVDIDELWEYPYQNQIPLTKFLAYLDKHNYNAVMSVMVDMFADLPLKNLQTLQEKPLKQAYPFFDNSHMKITPYQKAYNTINHPKTSHFRGGIHDQIFDIKNIYLSKMPLIKWNESIDVHETSHTSTHVNIADVSTVLLHYKFVYGFYEKIQRVLKEKNYWNASETYQKYLDHIQKNPDLNIHQATAKKYISAENLENEGTVWMSDAFKEFVK